MNNVFTSNTYLIKDASRRNAFLIDIGEFEKTITELRGYDVKAIFLTHCHYDHIYFIENLVAEFPEIKIYGHPVTLEALEDPKKNLSFYHDDPVSYNGSNLFPLPEDQQNGIVQMTESVIYWYRTPGHHPGSVSYKFGSYLFTGDSFIPGIPVVTKLRGGNKEESKQSVAFLREKIINDNLIIAPGHGKMMNQQEIEKCELEGKNESIR